MDWQRLQNPENCPPTKNHYIKQLKTLNSIVAPKNDKFYYQHFYNKADIVKIYGYFKDQDFEYTTMSQYIRTLISALNMTPNLPYKTNENYHVFLKYLKKSQESALSDYDLISTDVEIIDYTKLNKLLKETRDDIRELTGLRSIVAWFASFDTSNIEQLKDLQRVNFSDFINTRVDKHLEGISFFEISTNKWHINRQCHGGKSISVTPPKKYIQWIKDNMSNGRWLAPRKNGTQYTQTSTLSNKLSERIGLDFNTIKRSIINQYNAPE